MGQLRKRLLFSSIVVPLAIAAMFLAPMWLYVIVVEALVLLSMNEFFSLVEKKEIRVNRLAGLFFGMCIPISFLYHSDAMFLVLASLTFFIYNFKKEHIHHALVSTSVTMFAVVYIAWFFSHLIYLRQLEHGAQWVFFVVLIVKGGDAGAYFVGKPLGRTKLLKSVSPNKSVEGAVGGLLTSVVLAGISKLYIPEVGFLSLLILGALASIISQLGDLSESLIKRDAGIKDSGVIPGIGGVLDMIDSLVVTIPFVYYFVTGLAGFMK